MARTDAHLRIRVPDDVKVWLKAQATKNLRTQSAEIVLAVRAQMEAERKTKTERADAAAR